MVESNSTLSGPFLREVPFIKLTGDVLGKELGGGVGWKYNLDRTSAGRPRDWPCGTSQTVISSAVVEPNAEANKICSSYAWETSQSQLPSSAPSSLFRQGKAKIERLETSQRLGQFYH